MRERDGSHTGSLIATARKTGTPVYAVCSVLFLSIVGLKKKTENSIYLNNPS